jgi:hypothetical protein
VWPPLLAKGTVVAGTGLKGSLVGTVARKDGTLQLPGGTAVNPPQTTTNSSGGGYGK